MTTATARVDRRSPDEILVERMRKFRYDPIGYVRYVFPWGEGSLQGHDGPREWQADTLRDIAAAFEERGFDWHDPQPVDPVRLNVASGHGIGKSALTGMLVSWLLDTRPGAKGIVTANTGPQLRTKTFAEISKWKKLAVTAHWWDIVEGDMSVRSKQRPNEWRCDALTWKKEHSEAFAGLHAVNSTPFYIFDEASAVDDKIFEVAEGGLTDGEPLVVRFGNPTRNSGSFYRGFTKERHRWINRQIDSRTVPGTNKKLMQEWVEDFGEDSDFVRVRVRGIFPRSGVKQFIGNDLIELSMRADPQVHKHTPLVIGVDVAREGDDESVIAIRRGNDARTHEWKVFRLDDSMQLAYEVADVYESFKRMGTPVAAGFIDGVGVGGPVADRIRELGYPIIDVNAGATAQQNLRFGNKGTECWSRLREWLKGGGCLPDDITLHEQLTTRSYDFTNKQQIQLTPKRLQKEEFGSPDRADALTLTFAQPVASRPPGSEGRSMTAKHEYDPLEG